MPNDEGGLNGTSKSRSNATVYSNWPNERFQLMTMSLIQNHGSTTVHKEQFLPALLALMLSIFREPTEELQPRTTTAVPNRLLVSKPTHTGNLEFPYHAKSTMH